MTSVRYSFDQMTKKTCFNVKFSIKRNGYHTSSVPRLFYMICTYIVIYIIIYLMCNIKKFVIVLFHWEQVTPCDKVQYPAPIKVST